MLEGVFMNESPEGTPNPLNPNQRPEAPSSEALDANPAEPIFPISGGRSVDGVIRNNHIPIQEATKENTPIKTSRSAQPVWLDQLDQDEQPEQLKPLQQPEWPERSEQLQRTETLTSSIDSPKQIDQPIEKTLKPEAKPRKKKIGLIIAVLICLLIAVGCSVAAILLAINTNDKDSVSIAMKKLMQGEVPTNIAIEGDIIINNDDVTSPIAEIQANLDAKFIFNSQANSIDTKINLKPRQSNKDLTFNISEITSLDGDTYLKLNGLNDVFSDSITSADDDFFFIENPFGFMDSVEDVWVRLPADNLVSFSDIMEIEGPTSCMIDLFSNINKDNNSAAELYNKNPFITTSPDSVTIISRRDPIYKVEIDSPTLTNFINSIQNVALLDDLYSCFGWEGNVSASTNDVISIVGNLPAIYVEINKDDLFTRLYLKYDDMTVDLNISYPANVNILEPSEYQDFSNILQQTWIEF